MSTVALSNTEIQHRAQLILNEPEFQRAADYGQSFDIWKWLLDQLHWKMPPLPEFHFGHFNPLPALPFLPQLILYGLGVLGLIIVGYGLYFLIKRLPWFSRSADTARVTLQERQAAQAHFVALAAEALQNNNYRLAMHYLLLAAVSRVIRDVFFDAATDLTNRELVLVADFTVFRQTTDLVRLFEMLVYQDERIWFGRQPITGADYDIFAGHYQAFEAMLNA